MKYITDEVLIYDKKGNKIDNVKLPERIMAIPAKRGGFSEKGIYYKGSGIVYRNHLTNEVEKYEKKLVETGIVYEKYAVNIPEIEGKYGIFILQHQPIFSDYEGGCGKKEQNLLENQRKFALSAIEEIVDVIPTGLKEHSIYAYRLKNVRGGLEDTVKLIEYILKNDFNTAWDKNLWSDIYAFGYVRDVADWFISSRIEHKIGTVYALLNSIYRQDIVLYGRLLLIYFGKYSFEKYKIIYYSCLIVEKYSPELFVKENIQLNNENAPMYDKILELLFLGKACCHLEDDKKWDWVRGYYCKKYGKILKK